MCFDMSSCHVLISSYAKGASLIRMLNDTIGDDAFERGVKLYLKRWSWKNTKTGIVWRGSMYSVRCMFISCLKSCHVTYPLFRGFMGCLE